MANLSYPGGAGITVVTNTGLEANDMTFLSTSLAGAAQQTDYSDIKAGIVGNPGALGGVTPGTSLAIAGDIIIAGTSSTHLLFADASADRVGINTDTPRAMLEVAGEISVKDATGGSGGLVLEVCSEDSGILSGASGTITLGIPGNALLVGVQLRVDIAITDDDGDDTWSAAYSGGATQAIATGAAATKNTKVNKFFDAHAATPIVSGTTEITLTPNGTNFTGGQVSAVIYIYEFFTLANA